MKKILASAIVQVIAFDSAAERQTYVDWVTAKAERRKQDTPKVIDTEDGYYQGNPRFLLKIAKPYNGNPIPKNL